MLFISHLPFNNILVWKWSVIAGIYMAMRVFSRKNWILWGVVLFGIVQAFCAIGQQIGYIASNHNLFDVTGFMGNPGATWWIPGFRPCCRIYAIEEKYKLPTSDLCYSCSSAYRLFTMVSRLESRMAGIHGRILYTLLVEYRSCFTTA